MSLPLLMSNLKQLLDKMYSVAEEDGNGTAMTTILDVWEQIEVSFHE